MSDDRRSTPRRARWLPEQHGAWAMLLLPFAAGTWLAGPTWAHLPLLLTWVGGYLAYAAATRWLRARGRSRSARPVLVLTTVAGLAGLATAALAPRLLAWLLAYTPLLGASLWLAARGAERSLANDALAALAASLMAAVAFDAGGGGDWLALWVAAAVLLAYFLGTVLYVKTMIRERGRRGYVIASVACHAAGTLGASVLAARGLQGWALTALWALLTLRALAGPALNARRRRALRPAVVGAGEIVASLALTVLALAGLPA